MERQKQFTISISRDELNLVAKSLTASADHFGSRAASLRSKGQDDGASTMAASGARYRRLLDRILAETGDDAPGTDAWAAEAERRLAERTT
jgi:hypothetical protein